MYRTRHFPETREPHNLERWLLTYADMITLLTAFFLLLYSMSVVSRGKFTRLASSVRSGFGAEHPSGPHILNGGGTYATPFGSLPPREYREYEQAMRNLGSFVEQQNLRGKVGVRSDERGLVISLVSDDLLFRRGQAGLRPEVEPLLRRVTQVIRPLSNQIQIEGHTCDLPIRTAQFPSNWELSTMRAGTVLRYFTERMGLRRQRFIAAGYADTRPLVANTDENNRARNRRVDIVIVKSEAQRQADAARQAEVQRILVNPESHAATPERPPSGGP